MKKIVYCSALILILLTSTVSRSETINHQQTYKFPDFGFMLPAESYHGAVFKLSDNYPDKLPALDADVKKILAIDFKKNWKQYALAVQRYAFKDNIDFANNELSFNFPGQQSSKWFHIPWQHWGEKGREGFHGLTKEGPLMPYALATQQKTGSNAYAVGFYNRQGGYAIGQVWQDPTNPDLTYMVNNGFPVGTVVAKFLFTTLADNEVPHLTNPVEWQAYVYKCDIPGNPADPCQERQQTTVRLLQMDIMVKDPRAVNSNGWVFGTFVYNGKLNNKNPWMNLQPVGLMWGNDPQIALSNSNPKPQQTMINKNLQETVINEDPTMPAQHLGWNGRLNGPADNPNSSCMSCHSTAQFPVVSGLMPFLNNPAIAIPKPGTTVNPDWMRWFRNFDSNIAFDGEQAMTTDFSLQLSQSIQNFIEYRSQAEQGHYHEQYWLGKHKITRGSAFSSKVRQ